MLYRLMNSECHAHTMARVQVVITRGLGVRIIEVFSMEVEEDDVGYLFYRLGTIILSSSGHV